MFPTINFTGKDIPTYGILATAGILLLLFLSMRVAKKFKVDTNDILITLLVAGIGVVIGGHLVYALTNFDKIIVVFQNLDKITSFGILFDVLGTIFGGQVFYGGLLGGLLAAYIYLKKTKKDVALYAYIITPFIPLFHGLGRIGCFLAGCCYGVEMENGIVFHNSSIPAANGVPRLPIQLIEALCNFALFGVLLYLQKKGKCKKTLLYIYLLSYSVIRFVDEFFRGDSYRGFVGPVSTSQFISILIFIFTIIALIVTNKKTIKSPTKPTPTTKSKKANQK
ncbi:prolipoprotein diacylglyceryl transferase [Candidatus Saccharibacteria bacterium]|nr:prolipoprotein diacylglyceryl transferase [Candidatus Saccharibacteria bacterium]